MGVRVGVGVGVRVGVGVGVGVGIGVGVGVGIAAASSVALAEPAAAAGRMAAKLCCVGAGRREMYIQRKRSPSIRTRARVSSTSSAPEIWRTWPLGSIATSKFTTVPDAYFPSGPGRLSKVTTPKGTRKRSWTDNTCLPFMNSLYPATGREPVSGVLSPAGVAEAVAGGMVGAGTEGESRRLSSVGLGNTGLDGWEPWSTGGGVLRSCTRYGVGLGLSVGDETGAGRADEFSLTSCSGLNPVGDGAEGVESSRREWSCLSSLPVSTG